MSKEGFFGPGGVLPSPAPADRLDRLRRPAASARARPDAARRDASGPARGRRREVLAQCGAAACASGAWRAAWTRLARNADGDELLFVHAGDARAATVTSAIWRVRAGDYVMLPRGTMWRLEVAAPVDAAADRVDQRQLHAAGQGLVGPHAIFDPAMLDTPRIDEAFKAQQSSTQRVAGRGQAARRHLPHHLSLQSARCDRLARRTGAGAHQRARHPAADEPPLPPAAVGAHDVPVGALRRLHVRAAAVRDRSEARSRCRSSTTTTTTTKCIFYHAGDFFSRDNIHPGHAHLSSGRLHARAASEGADAHVRAGQARDGRVRGDDRHARPARRHGRRPRGRVGRLRRQLEGQNETRDAAQRHARRPAGRRQPRPRARHAGARDCADAAGRARRLVASRAAAAGGVGPRSPLAHARGRRAVRSARRRWRRCRARITGSTAPPT